MQASAPPGGRLLLLVVGVIVGLGLGELAARLLPEPDTYDARVRAFASALVVPHPTRRHALRPLASVEVAGIRYETSELGTRGALVTTAEVRAEPDEVSAGAPTRVLALGDSLTMGWGVALAHAWPTRLGAALARAHHPVSLTNAGVLGYGLREEVATLAELGPRLRPELVVVGYFPNDPEDLDAAPSGRGPSWSRLWDRVAPRFSALAFRLGATETAVERYQALHAPGSASLARLVGALDDLAEACQPRAAVGPRCVLVLLPALVASPYPLTELHARVAELAAARGLRSLDLAPTMEGRDPLSFHVAPDDAHPNAAAHALYADAIAAWLVSEGIGPATPSASP